MDANIFPFYFWGDKVNHSSSPIQKKEDIFSGFLTFIFSLLPEAGILSFFTLQLTLRYKSGCKCID